MLKIPPIRSWAHLYYEFCAYENKRRALKFSTIAPLPPCAAEKSEMGGMRVNVGVSQFVDPCLHASFEHYGIKDSSAPTF